MTRINLSIVIAVAAVAGCSNSQPIAPDFGNAVASNIAAQVVNPAPIMGSQDFDTSGQRMGSAMERYNRNKVYAPQPPVSSVAPVGVAPPPPDTSGSGSD
jgi:type IV pilus biogenesis protein CpaD/CtpE